MLETAIAVLFVTFLFLCLFQVTQMLSAKVLLDHAAARAARAKAVGFNDWMCLKSARVAMIPVAGKLLWPEYDDEYSGMGRFGVTWRVPDYLASENEPLARGILEYERWNTMDFWVKSGYGISSEAEAYLSIGIPRFYARNAESDFDGYGGGEVEIEGEAKIESHYPFYMYDQGL